MSTKVMTVAQELNESVASVIGQHHIIGFEKAYLIADATNKLKELLSPQYMKPIMALQGNKLGFRTDKDSEGGYSEAIVKNCLIEAVLTGLQPHGNQFNIIAGNMYPTKEGLGYLLGNFKGLSYSIVPDLPRVNSTNTSAAITMNVSWSVNGSPRQKQSIEIPIKVNKFMGTDAIIGKATRKARAWLYSTITGSEISEGEVGDLDSPDFLAPVAQNHVEISNGKEHLRIIAHIENSKTIKELSQVEKMAKDNVEIDEKYQAKLNELVFEGQ